MVMEHFETTDKETNCGTRLWKQKGNNEEVLSGKLEMEKRHSYWS